MAQIHEPCSDVHHCGKEIFFWGGGRLVILVNNSILATHLISITCFLFALLFSTPEIITIFVFLYILSNFDIDKTLIKL